jgi:putative photosynthetic complex assembly protein
MSALDERPFPRGALLGAAGLIAITIIGVGANQIIKFSAPAGQSTESALGPVRQARDLKFVDEGGGVNAFGGQVAVYDVATGAFIGKLTTTDGFIRAVLNSLEFERTKRSVAGATIFRLVERVGGHLTLEDPATGRSVNLGAFGPDNRAVFLRFLPTPAEVS